MRKTSIALFLLLFCFITSASAQLKNNQPSLAPGKNISAEIAPGEIHNYSVDLKKDQYAFFRLMQKGVDVQISTYGPDGKTIETIDSPNGKNGYETFSLRSNDKGTFRIEVSPIEDEGKAGSYDLKFEDVKAKAITPGEQVDEIFAAYNNSETPGAAVAVVKDGKIIYKKGYGLANLEYNIPVTPSTIFHVASVSKQFTVFSILLLEKEGKLSLDDDIRKYIPEVPDFGKKITLRHLANHTSGLRDQWTLLVMAGWRMDDVITRDHILQLVSQQKDLNFEPGAEFSYSNTGFTLLAEVVARVSDKSFAEFTEERIFEPLGMNNTLFYDDHEKIVKNRAYSYYADSTGYKKSVLSFANVGATSLFTTVEDLSLWAINFSNPKVGDTAIFNKMNTPAVLNDGKEFGGALGQFVGDYKGIKIIQHGGADAGYRSYLSRFPDENIAVVVFGNEASFSSGNLASKVADIFLKDRIKAEEKPVAEEKAEEAKIQLDPVVMENYVGDYEVPSVGIISITRREGDLFARPANQPALKMVPVSTTEFSVETTPAKISFSSANGKVEKMEVKLPDRTMEGKRLAAFDKSAVKLADYEGTYYSDELSTEYIFKVKDGKLVADHRRLSDIELTPVKHDAFAGDQWFFSQVDFVRNESKEISGLKVSSGRVKNLVFEKIK